MYISLFQQNQSCFPTLFLNQSRVSLPRSWVTDTLIIPSIASWPPLPLPTWSSGENLTTGYRSIDFFIHWNLVNSTSDNSKTCLFKSSFMVPVWVIRNANLLGISRTFSHNSNCWTVVSAIKLPFLWLNVFTLLCKKLNFLFYFSHLTNWRKFSQEMEYTRAKWSCYGGHMAEAKGEHNS